MYLSYTFVKFCVCPYFSVGIEGRMWDMIVLIQDQCHAIFFSPIRVKVGKDEGEG